MSDGLDDVLADYETADKSWIQFERNPDVDSSVVGEVTVLVEGGETQALVDIGWDDSGVYADVRMYRDRQLVESEQLDVLGTVSLRPGD
jgi:hypothetical protein